ncbi:MAG: hypothetical protein ACRCWQ_14510, partial [Bacilli bacterium]
MLQKYKLLHRDESGLCRIQALRDFGDVKAGDVGGYVETDYNLSHRGSCWIHDNARVVGDSYVYDSAQVYDNVRVSGNSRVYGSARVSGKSQVLGRAYVTETCTKTPKTLIGFQYVITITDEHLRVGCQV